MELHNYMRPNLLLIHNIIKKYLKIRFNRKDNGSKHFAYFKFRLFSYYNNIDNVAVKTKEKKNIDQIDISGQQFYNCIFSV